jgi:hypothetical protein
MSEPSIHVAVRIPIKSRVGTMMVDVIQAHNEAAEKWGLTTFAKFGRLPSSASLKQLSSQLEEGRECYLVLVAKVDQTFVGFEAPLVSVHVGRPTSTLTTVAPRYYSQLVEEGQLWLSISRGFKDSDLSKWRLRSSKRPLLEVVRECRTSLIFVERQCDMAILQSPSRPPSSRGACAPSARKRRYRADE